MKILQVCSAQTMGGGERHVIDLTRALIERGHKLHLAVRKNNALRVELKNLPIIWHEIPLRNALDIFSALALAKIIRAENIEVMHAHVARDYTICGLAAKLAPVKFFLTRHHFNPINANFFYRWGLANVTKLIAVSQTVKTELALAFPELQARIVLIPNWIDPQKIATLSKEKAREALGIQQQIAVGIIGQISPAKGQHFFLQVAEHLQHNENLPSLPCFLIVGKSQTVEEQNFERELRIFSGQLIDSGIVKFTGFIPDIITKLAAFDIIVVASTNEGFSLVTIEAMAAGCAVIAFSSEALQELVQHNKTGLLCTPQNTKSLLQTLTDLVMDQEWRSELGLAGQHYALANFGRENVLNQITTLYDQAQ